MSGNIYFNSLHPEVVKQIKDAFAGLLTPDGITIIKDENNVISAVSNDYVLPTASNTVLGGVKVDGTTITIDANGIITAITNTPIEIINDLTTGGTDKALSAEQGKVLKGLIDNFVPFTQTEKDKLASIAENANNYVLPVATTDVLGGVKPDGTTITVDENGVMSANGTSTQPKTAKFTTTVEANETHTFIYKPSIPILATDDLDINYNTTSLQMGDWNVVDVNGEMVIVLTVEQSTDIAKNSISGRIYRGFDSI